jgi:aryl-alcohol dehydrogenase-like predicted oxidoreductase
MSKVERINEFHRGGKMDGKIQNEISIGQSDIKISSLGIGTNRWFYNKTIDPGLETTFKESVAAGIIFFDTAEIYGNGGSERALGELIRKTKAKVTVASKFFPSPNRLTENSFLSSLRQTLERLGMVQLDIYMLHFPFPPVRVETWMEYMANAVDAGLVKTVGISNCNKVQMKKAYDTLAKRHIPLICNEVEFNLIKREPMRNGVLDYCMELGVTMIAYRPLTSGLLSGKYSTETIPAMIRGQVFSKSQMKNWVPLLETLQRIADEQGKTTGQVALNWVICKGAIPIPGATSPAHVKENAGAMNWKLGEKDIAALDKAGIGL